MTTPPQAQSIHLSIHGPEGEDVLARIRSRSLRGSDAYRLFIESLRDHTPKAINRFASPSCPWPWAGDTESDKAQPRKARIQPGSRPPSPAPVHHFTTRDWGEYPERLFPNWTPYVVQRCGMQAMFDAQVGIAKCKIYPVDVLDDARFMMLEKVTHNLGVVDSQRLSTMTGKVEEFLETRPKNVRLRCLCVENLSGDVLRMLGSYYRIEPFYFSSAINRIPSRYHEHFQSTRTGDHMYITLPFLRMTKEECIGDDVYDEPEIMPAEAMKESINVFAPLTLVSANRKTRHTLQQDMLAVLLVRVEGQQTLISIHPGPIRHAARTLQDRIFMAGKGIYWGNLMRRAADPIFVLLIVMWSALYAWDEAMEVLYTHITYLETRVIGFTPADVDLAPQLHAIRAHLLYYDDLLEEFEKSLAFVGNVGISKQESDDREAFDTSKELLDKELRTLSIEVERLRRQRNMQDSRISNVMKLVLSILNIKETQTSLQHGESMKQITYLTMIYLPASFIASVFGMNIAEIAPQTNGTLAHYFAATIPLAVLTVWIAVGVSSRVQDRNAHMLRHIFWPFFAVWEKVKAACDSSVEGYYKAREKSRTPRETLRQVGKPISRRSRTRSRGTEIPMQPPRRTHSTSRVGRSTSRRRLTASQPDVSATARDFAAGDEASTSILPGSVSKTTTTGDFS